MEDKDFIASIRKRVKTISMMFLFCALVCPSILILMLFILYSQGLDVETWRLIVITFTIVIPIQILLALFMYFKYSKIYKLEDKDFIQTTFFKNFKNEFYTLNYSYNNHEIVLKSGLDYLKLEIDGIEVNKYQGNKNRNFNLEGKIGNDEVRVEYIFHRPSGFYKVYYNRIELKEKNKEYE